MTELIWENRLKEIPDDIPALVREYAFEHAPSATTFITYIQQYRKELVFRTFGIRHRTGKEVEITEVKRETPASKSHIGKNSYLTAMSGWRAVYQRKNVAARYYGYHMFYADEFDVWIHYNSNEQRMFAKVLNPEVVTECDKYKYSSYPGIGTLIDWLRAYNEHPEVELIGKIGVGYSPLILKKCSKDKGFAKYLNAHADECRRYGIKATIYAYDHHMQIFDAMMHIHNAQAYGRMISEYIPEFAGSGLDRDKLGEWLTWHDIAAVEYNDYLKAVKYLGYDLKDTKVAYPKEFWRMHEVRTNEYKAKKAEEDAKVKAALNDKLFAVARELKRLEYRAGKYMVLIPNSVGDLEAEGKYLEHCVGRMGYDVKMAEKKSFIAFVRRAEAPETPFVTLEVNYRAKVLQCYGAHNSNPDQDVRDFVSQWEQQIVRKELAA